MNHANNTALRTAVTCGHRNLSLILMEHGASSYHETFTPPMLKDLNRWMAEALKEQKRVIERKNSQMEEFAQGITAWCAQAASAVMGMATK